MATKMDRLIAANRTRQAKRAWMCGGLAAGLLLLAGCATVPEIERARLMANRNQFIEAIQTLESAQRGRNLLPFQREQVQTEINTLKSTLAREAVEEASQVYDRSRNLAGVRAAQAVLRQKQPYDIHNIISSKLAEYSRQLAQMEARRAELQTASSQAKRRSDWSEAYRHLQEAQRIDPAATSELAPLIEERNSYYAREIQRAIRDNQPGKARNWMVRFKQEMPPPSPARIQSLDSTLAAFLRRATLDEVRTLIRKRKYYTAYVRLQDLPDIGSRIMDPIRQRGAAHYLARHQKEMEKGEARLGYAYFAIVKALELDPTNPEIFNLHRDICDIIDRNINFNIALPSFESPTDDPDAGPEFSDGITTLIQGNIPANITLLERSKIRHLLDESPEDLIHRYKADLLIVGSVSSLRVERESKLEDSHEIVIKGTNTVPNPDYLAMLDMYGPNIKRWPSAPPPRMKAEPITEIISIKVGNESVEGLMRVTLSIFDKQGKITFTDTYESSFRTNAVRSGAIPSANRPAVLADLPSDIQVKNALRSTLLERVAADVTRAFQFREKRFLEKANWHLGRREFDAALTELAYGHYYCLKDMQNLAGGSRNKDYREIVERGLFGLTE